jgi:hypothetical protein
MKAERRKKRELRKELHKNRAARHSDSDQLDEEDMELLKENRVQRRKLKKLKDFEESEESPKKAKVDLVEQIDTKIVKAERNENQVKKQIFEKRGDTSTNAEDEKVDAG